MRITIPLNRAPLSHQHGIKYRLTKFGASSYKTSELAAYQQEIGMLVKSEANRQKVQRIKGKFTIDCVLFLRNRKRPDIDNMWKTICDSLEGILFENDRDCEELYIRILYDKANPRMELLCSPLDNE